MVVKYDVFISAFLSKIKEYEFLRMEPSDRDSIVNGYLKRVCARFNHVCVYDISDFDDVAQTVDIGGDSVQKISDIELNEIVDIVSEGMLVQWMKQYQYSAENLRNTLNTADFTSYSPSELLHRMTAAYNQCKEDFSNMMMEYSYCHGDLTSLHT